MARKPIKKKGEGISPGSDDTIVLARRRRVAKAYLRGKTQHEIAKAEGISQPMISKDLEVVREWWRESAVQAISEWKAKELARIDHIEEECWIEWEKSKEKKVKVLKRKEEIPSFRPVKQGQPPPKPIVKKTTERGAQDQTGADVYLARIAWCVEMRCKILGLYAQDETKLKKDRPGVTIQIDWDAMASPPLAPDPIEEEMRRAALPLKVETVDG